MPCLVCGVLSFQRLCETHEQEVKKEHEARRQAIKAQTKQYSGTYTKRAKAVRESAILCHICKEGIRINDPFEADHINPAENGSNALLLAAHRSCNRRRSNKPF
jgi:RIO-like serine/threonine protein kinase